MVRSLGNPPVNVSGYWYRWARLLLSFADQAEQTYVPFAVNQWKFSVFCAYIYMYVDMGIYVCIFKLPFQT
jgi:hypothetical protein